MQDLSNWKCFFSVVLGIITKLSPGLCSILFSVTLLLREELLHMCTLDPNFPEVHPVKLQNSSQPFSSCENQEPGKRSQLWRMTTTGMLQNEAFITPREPNSPGRQSRQCMVLDIMSSAPVYNGTSTLVLRSPAASRKSTQTWSFEKVSWILWWNSWPLIYMKEGFCYVQWSIRMSIDLN